MKLSTLQNKYNPLIAIERFTKLINSVNEANKIKNRFIRVIRQLYLIKIECKRFRKFVDKILKVNIKSAIENPDLFLIIATNYILCILDYCKLTNTNIDDLLAKVFSQNGEESVSIFFGLNKVDEGRLSKYHIIVRSKSPSDRYFKDKFIITKLTVDIDGFTCTIEENIYDCKTYEESKIGNRLIRNKTLRIGNNGRLYNPNYILDTQLLDDDYVIYKFMIIAIMCALSTIVESITAIKIIRAKRQL